ncbi:hypothetical protein [Colwellia sp. C1TZA3]|uniref:hypothetical protein n=1 Tax=Colwellia sp. C1TZA3 TaxID=2508879 RepID=UPI0011B9DC3C|nr:hypothetical protein [Colwellia sp. C1TZA3]TWX64735.1 hypothetical protein ESZ39_15890 [Colwellia sp. C1TZA3]
MKPTKLALISPATIEFKDLSNTFDAYVDGTVTGRTVVAINTSSIKFVILLCAGKITQGKALD